MNQPLPKQHLNTPSWRTIHKIVDEDGTSFCYADHGCWRAGAFNEKWLCNWAGSLEMDTSIRALHVYLGGRVIGEMDIDALLEAFDADGVDSDLNLTENDVLDMLRRRLGERKP